MAAIFFAIPMSGFDFAVGNIYFIEKCQKQCQCVFTNGISVSFRCGDQADVFCLGILNVDAFESSADTGDKLKVDWLFLEK